ncbi:MAG: iron-sulfur cluster co-chaperone HscB C-terminal domain-containing protein, partial [Myxococcales bacterium]|nr:Fe-S protein assembly co-chaperone HscB [Polyangiaceae bacterium]MDW8248290.1 iron-sulfur cluster co-chaperone HscB C-terminal domain-containing protein [Myxococcales bacterium]
VSQALLLEFLELREKLAEARAARDRDTARVLAARVQEREQAALQRLTVGFERLASATPDERETLTTALLEALGELRYVRRFLDEVRAVEEDAES